MRGPARLAGMWRCSIVYKPHGQALTCLPCPSSLSSRLCPPPACHLQDKKAKKAIKAAEGYAAV